MKIAMNGDGKNEQEHQDVLDIMERKQMVKMIGKKIEVASKLMIQVMRKQDFILSCA